MSSGIARALQQARNRHAQVAERMKVRFAVSLEQRRRARGLTYTDVAALMESSPAYITKVFKGDSNLTIETMAKLAVATGSELDIRLVELGTAVGSWNLTKMSPVRTPAAVASSFTYEDDQPAANHRKFEHLTAA